MGLEQISLERPREQDNTPGATRTRWLNNKWTYAVKQIFPLYFALHMALLILSFCAVLFTEPDFSALHPHLHDILLYWSRNDVNWYRDIAIKGYTNVKSTAFFPLFPLLIRLGTYVTGLNGFYVGVFISNVAWFVLLIVLFQLVREDFDEKRAQATILYLSLFPTSFFFATSYTEAPFLCLALLSFYHLRRGHWWLAALFAFFAGLTRSAGVFLALPFCYEYMRQRQFRVREIRFNAISVFLIPLGIILFAGYCYMTFGDPLAFSHAQSFWLRQLSTPWYGVVMALVDARRSALLAFGGIRNLLDTGCVLFVFFLLLLGSFGPWRLGKEQASYLILAWTFYVFVLLFPVHGDFPLQSMPRYMLEIFPAFIILAGFDRVPFIRLNYFLVSGVLLFVMMTQFLTGHWIT